MTKFLEFLKKFGWIKKIGSKVLLAKDRFYRFIADESYFDSYNANFLILPGCEDRSLKHEYLRGNLKQIQKPIGEHYKELLSSINEKIAAKTGGVIVRTGDGELNFIRGIVRGNTATRHFTSGKDLSKEYREKFKKGLLDCDSAHVEMYKNLHRALKEIYGRTVSSSIPAECIYGLIASRDILRTNYKIGIIGADNKIAIIQKLLGHEEYRSYIGRNQFEHYISVPEKGSSNNADDLAKVVSEQLRPDIDIYLVGIGIAKLVVLPVLKKNSKTLFVDVGCGISALAGLVSADRPYFAHWTNFRLKGFDYSKVDIMDADMDKGGKVYL